MCLPAATLVPLVAGAGLQAASYFMNKNAEEGAYSRQRDITQQMFDLSNQNRGNTVGIIDKQVEGYAPQAYEQKVGQEKDAIVQRGTEQYEAAQARAPDKTFTGTVTEGFDDRNAANAQARASEFGDELGAWASIAAPATVNAADRRGTRRAGEQMALNNAGEGAQQQYLGMAAQNVRPNYSVVSDLASAFGNAAMTAGISNWAGAGLKPPTAAWTTGKWYNPSGRMLNWAP